MASTTIEYHGSNQRQMIIKDLLVKGDEIIFTAESDTLQIDINEDYENTFMLKKDDVQQLVKWLDIKGLL